MNLDELRGRPTISVTELAQVLHCGRNQAYQAVREGTIPSLRLGASIRIPTPKLLALLGATTNSETGPASPAVATLKPAEGAHDHGDTPALRSA